MNELLNRILEELRNAWRFRWVALAMAWIVALAGWLFVYSLPDQYEVEARVHIDTKSAIRPLLGGMAVLPSLDEQVSFLVQTVLSRPNLEDIARRTGLDINATTPRAEDALLDGLQERIHIRSTARNINLFNISFSSTDAETARNVVQQVINIMTGMAVSDRGESSDRAMSFLSREVDRYKSELDQIERKLAVFKKENAELMPGQQDYVTRLQTLQADLEWLNDELTGAKNRRDILQQEGASGSRVVSPEQSQQVQSIDAQIQQRQNRLDQLLTRYTEQYPDVVTLREDISRLQQERQQTVAELRRNPERVTVTGGSGVQQQLTDVQVDIDTLETKIERKRQRLEELKAGAEDMSDTQARYAELQRNYEVTKGQYNKLLDRLYSARLSGDVERSGNNLQFRVIDPPEVPTEPTGPDRFLFLTMVLAGSMAAGAAFAFFLSQIRPVFINRRSLTDFTGLPVLGAVSMASGIRDKVRRQTSFALFLAGAATLVLGYLGAVAFASMGVRIVPSILSSQWL